MCCADGASNTSLLFSPARVTKGLVTAQLGYLTGLLTILGRVALVAQRPIVVKLSRERSVGLSVGPSAFRSVQCIVENGGSDLDAVWHHRSDGSRDE